MKIVSVLFISIISISAYSQTTTGKIVVKKGQHFVVESTSDGTVNQEMMGQSMEMKIGSTTKLNADIKEVKDNNYTITQTLTNVKSKFSGMGQEKSFDSDKKEDLNGEAGAIYKDKFNIPKDVVVTNEGKNVVSTDSAYSKKQDPNPMAAMMDMMGGGQDNVATALFLVIPAGKKVGDSWMDSTNKEGIKINRTYTLNSIKNKEASITINGLININKTMQMQGMDMNAVMVSKVISAVLVDIDSNVQKENKSVTDVNGTIDVMGQSVPITSKATTVTTVKSI